MVHSRILTASGVFVLLAGLIGGVFLEARPDDSLRRGGFRQKKEEEEDTPPPKKKVIRLDEEDDKPKTKDPAPGPAPAAEVIDLGKAARAAKHPEVKRLFEDFAFPADRIELKRIGSVTVGGGSTQSGLIKIKPLAQFIKNHKELKAALPVEILDDAGKEGKSDKIGPGLMNSLTHYEQAAVLAAGDFLDRGLDKLDTSNPRYLARYEQYIAAEQMLSFVLRFHQSARERKVRDGDEWVLVEDELRHKLLDVLMKQLDQLIDARSWEPAFEMLRRMTDTFRRAKEHVQLAPQVAKLLKGAMADSSFTAGDRLREARRRLRQFESEFPNSEIIKPISESLREQALALFDRAKELSKLKDNTRKSEIQDLLRQAVETWPELPGLRAYLLQTESDYRIFRVGMREQPRLFSPAWAVTDADLRAVDLLFESLTVMAPDVRGMVFPHAGLAEGKIQIVPLGRQFTLPRSARWTDGQELTSDDLSFSVAQLQEGKSVGRSAAWGEMLTRVRVEGDPFKAKVGLRQGYIDPLALMSFKIVPRRARPHPDSEDFARKPISSGPFEIDHKVKSIDGIPVTKFAANPHYGVRGDKLGLPKIREVIIYTNTEPAKDLAKERPLDLVLDLTAKQAAELDKGKYEVPMPSENSVNRRIYFLAVNQHQRGALSNPDLRLGLAHAIDREALLDRHFREGLERKVHKAINGPYPARSWACNSRLAKRENSLDPHDLDMARTKTNLAVKKTGQKQLSFTLKYPAGDKAVAAAMTDLCDRVNEQLPGIKLTPQVREPNELRDDIEKTHDYDLAYWWYDFPDETFWLMPLLGASGKEGKNYLGYSGVLTTRIEAATNLRHFDDVKKHAHAIHQLHLESEMPFVPLWQLDMLYAYRKDKLDAVPFDPNRIFARIEQWKVK